MPGRGILTPMKEKKRHQLNNTLKILIFLEFQIKIVINLALCKILLVNRLEYSD